MCGMRWRERACVHESAGWGRYADYAALH
jgi:hypothetical protein